MAYVNDTGLPSVTEILAPWIDSQWFTEESRERGQAVHAACHSYIIGRYVIPLPGAWRGYLDSFKRWCDRFEPTLILAEKRLKDETLGFCGQPDLIVNGPPTNGIRLIDIKTGVAFQNYWKLQVAAYNHLAQTAAKIDTKWGCILRLRNNGDFPIIDIWDENIALDFNRFLGALNLHKYFNK
jgi:hypothetical protein